MQATARRLVDAQAAEANRSLSLTRAHETRLQEQAARAAAERSLKTEVRRPMLHVRSIRGLGRINVVVIASRAYSSLSRCHISEAEMERNLHIKTSTIDSMDRMRSWPPELFASSASR